MRAIFCKQWRWIDSENVQTCACCCIDVWNDVGRTVCRIRQYGSHFDYTNLNVPV